MKKNVRNLFLTMLAAALMCAALFLPAAAATAGAGTEEDPWLIGAGTPESVMAYMIDEFTLWIDGEGDMADFTYPTDRPWNDLIADVEDIFVGDGVTGIGANAFYGAGRDVDYFDWFCPESVTRIGAGAFENAHFTEANILNIGENVTEIGSRAFAGSGLARVDMMGHPAVAADAFAGVTAEVYTVYEGEWSEEEKQSFGGELTYKNLYRFDYEEDFGTPDQTGSGCLYLPEGESYTYNAQDYYDDCLFLRWEVLEGDLEIADPTDPELELLLTGNVRVKACYEAGTAPEPVEQEDTCPFVITKEGGEPEANTDYIWSDFQSVLFIQSTGLTVSLPEGAEEVNAQITVAAEDVTLTIDGVTLRGENALLGLTYPNGVLVLRGENRVESGEYGAFIGGTGLKITGDGKLTLTEGETPGEYPVALLFAEPALEGVSVKGSGEKNAPEKSLSAVAFDAENYTYTVDEVSCRTLVIAPEAAERAQGHMGLWIGAGAAAVIVIALAAVVLLKKKNA